MRPHIDESLIPIEGRILAASTLLCCLDYDGTLTPLVDDPGSAALPVAAREALLALSRQRGVSVAIVSGRKLADLTERVGLGELTYAGNHGLEIGGPGCHFTEPAALACVGALGELASALTGQLSSVPGAMVEDKGLTLSVHYRQVADDRREEVRRIVHNHLARTDYPFQLKHGHEVYEIRPRVDWNKGTAVRWLGEQLGHADSLVVYAGDDSTDEDAFEVLGEQVTIKIGDASETLAQYRLDSPDEVHRFLRWLGGIWQRKGTSS